MHLQLVAGVLVFVGGAVGTAARYGCAQVWPTESGSWPTGTFVVNLIGSFVLGVLLEGLVRAGPDVGARQRTRLLLGTGFCGGFTTYSTLAVEANLLVRDHHLALALGYVAASVVAGVRERVAALTARFPVYG